ncbi:MAG: branched-chain amino acid ABC transporter permease [Desulfobacca sp.]|nr:branched-chain amino acid ABC transporter permease [Desulfobacca sp.]
MEKALTEDNKNWMKRGWWLILLIALGLIAPHVISEFYLLILGEALIMSLFALSFNLLFGTMGQLPFGQAAFYGMGGYGMAMLLTKFQVNFWLSFVAGIGIAALIGLLVGLFCVRLRGIYFSILTLAFGQLIFVIIYKWHDFTGGDDGIQGVFPPEFLKDPIAYYYFILVIFCLSALILWRIIHSPFGYTLQAMRENSERTEFLGIPIARYMLIAFVISAAFTGLAGALWAPFYRSVAPSTLMWIKSGEPVMATILGGAGLFFGPVLGTFLITFIHAYLLGFTHFWPIIMGTLILIVIFLLPGGILGFIKEKWENRQNRNQ